MFKPWAITSITIAVAVALVLWWRLIRFEYALLVTIATAAVTLAYSSPEPYAAMITVLLPPLLVLTWSACAPAIAAASVTPQSHPKPSVTPQSHPPWRPRRPVGPPSSAPASSWASRRPGTHCYSPTAHSLSR
ncbi:hypothetical protein BZL30_3776 [Mycobacterium kansasii]|uniref:Arabinofuranosyltransferase AftA N-terminal domain-containing protein n=1 Tax=Mycobacterium kansasii TaxID=1768 RepID=A0A1V3X9H4_MYCKA|nr:hypothetical protein BZL30_3776 [Mycobacterium kansasii]